MIEAVLKIRPPECWVCHLIRECPEARVAVMDYKVFNRSNMMQHLIEITVPPDLTGNLVDYIRSDQSLREVELITSDGGRIFGSVKTKLCLPIKLATTSGCFLRFESTRLDKLIEWNIVGSHESFQRLLKKFEEEGIEAEVVSLSGFKNGKSLTAKQELFLRVAFEKGFYEYPKRVHLENLADSLGITPAALTETLRKGVKKVLAEHFGRNALKTGTRMSPATEEPYPRIPKRRT